MEKIELKDIPDYILEEDIKPPYQDVMRLTASQQRIAAKCDELKNLLLAKNRKYGDSALNPIRVASRADAVEQIKVRFDDKLSRLKSDQADEDEDVLQDMAGYLILWMLAKENQANG